MTKIEAVRNMQLYIEKHIDCKISLADLSRVLSLLIKNQSRCGYHQDLLKKIRLVMFKG